uniref:Retrovirus-related Pol polyprotein from type-2 retrotransposable element R2DM n=1 Tax=Cajanus cajan TaxID=3821 RepID=A0A151U408_CAJCA|nr:Retrovirus-related Pol polyprotein from type-2 retrotransposable element R2DM [Cajanus cajan]
MTLQDFGPINLCNVALKIISKVLVNLDSIIGPLQRIFILSRGMKDNALIAQDIVQRMHKKRGRSDYLAFKIDFEKAYDNIKWDFLELTFRKFGFSQNLVSTIMSMITSSTLSLKWNGES